MSVIQKTLPSVPEEITAAWLGEKMGLPVKSIDITRTILDASASKVFATITYEDEETKESRPTYICVKGGFNPVMVNMEGYKEILRILYSREIQFFLLVAPQLTNMGLVKSWWAGEDTEQGQAIVIMDDLSKNYTFGDPVDDWPVERVKKGVEQLAALHAGTWGASTAEGEFSSLTPVYEVAMVGLAAQWDAMVLAEGRPPIPEGIRDQERTVGAMKKHFATKNPKFRAVLHGDPHTGNTYLDKDGSPFFLDWQTLYIGSSLHDFDYFVVGALSVEDRRKHEMEILDHYLAALARFGGPTLSSKDEDVILEFKKCTLSGLGWVLTPFEMQRKERVFAMVARYTAAMVDHDAIRLVESLPDPEV